MSHATARPRRAGTSFESQATNAAGSGYESQPTGTSQRYDPAHYHPGQARNAYPQLGGYRVSAIRVVIT
jgi:hypothetical protein